MGLLLAILIALPTVPSSPPAMPAMVKGIEEYRQSLLSDWRLEWLETLNGPYTSHSPRREAHAFGSGSSELNGVAPPGGTTGMGSDVEQWRPLVEIHFGERTDGALRVMECESGGNPGAYNASSGASGLFQFLGSTWRRVGGEGDVFDPAENIRRAAVLSKGGTDWHEWTCKP